MDLVSRLFGEAWEHRRRRQRNAGLVAAAVALVMAVSLFVGLGGAGSSGDGAGVTHGKPSAVFGSHRVASVLLNHYSVLRNSRVSLADLPRWVRKSLEAQDQAQNYGLDTSDIGQARSGPGIKVWLIPGATGACAFESSTRVQSGAGACGALPGAGSFGPGAGVTNYADSESAIGFTPDGIRSVTAHLVDGKTISAPVKDNAYIIEASGQESIAYLTAITAAGKEITSRHGFGR